MGIEEKYEEVKHLITLGNGFDLFQQVAAGHDINSRRRLFARYR